MPISNTTPVTTGGHAAGRPAIRFSLIAAVYNVDRYLADFIASIEQQTFPLDRVQVVVVDDGSTDDSLTTLKEWSLRQPELVTVLTKENGGQGAARNLGMQHATGEWIGFPDPDDILDSEYLARVDAFIRENEAAELIATNRIMFDERTGERADTHPLRRMFRAGDRIVDPNRFPDFFHGTAAAAFFRADLLARENLQFDDRVRPNFEDGHFCCRYLLATEGALIGFVKSAVYVYRKRADSSSTLQTGLMDPDRFVASPRFGYLDILRRGAELKGEPPEWLQSFVLYELSYYFSSEQAMSGVPTAAHGDVAVRFVQTLREIADLLRPEVIEGFRLRRFDRVWQEIMLHGLGTEPWVTPYAVIQKTDLARNMVQIAYRFVGEPPEERLLIRGLPYPPAHAKVRVYEFWDQPLLKERLAWVPASDTLRVTLNGRPVDLRAAWPDRTYTMLRPSERERLLAGTQAAKGDLYKLSVRGRLVRRAARTLPVRLFFRNAWVLLDRLHAADDNAERLFRYLRRDRHDVNAWFVIEKGTPDWKRLHDDGYRRVIPHGTLRWQLLMLNCKHLISSHVDLPVVQPPEIIKYGPPQWRVSFLQHGVIKDDISRWLNRKQIDLFVTSTPAEQASIAGDNTPYAFTSYEVKMTGLPRFDRLLKIGNEIPAGKRDLVLVCPTWRQWLSEPKSAGSHRRVVRNEFFDSEFARQWLAFLRDDRLRALAEREHLTIGFLPHPNLQAALSEIDLPPHVTPLHYEGEDVQRTFARAAVMVTDYSSTAFNAAYIERPVVYFQFDAEQVLGGGHTGRYGYYDYERDGFGPVARTAGDAVAEIEAIVAGGRVPAPEYLDRIRATFPERDGNCCARTADAIRAMDKPERAWTAAARREAT